MKNSTKSGRRTVNRSEWDKPTFGKALREICQVLWVTVALGLPFWLFRIPPIGVPLMIVAPVVVNTDLARSLRWRRQYESSIDRLIRTIGTHDSGGPSRSNP